MLVPITSLIRVGWDMAGIFGTDGVRAKINTGHMRAEFIVRLALAAGSYFIAQQDKTKNPATHAP